MKNNIEYIVNKEINNFLIKEGWGDMVKKGGNMLKKAGNLSKVSLGRFFANYAGRKDDPYEGEDGWGDFFTKKMANKSGKNNILNRIGRTMNYNSLSNNDKAVVTNMIVQASVNLFPLFLASYWMPNILNRWLKLPVDKNNRYRPLYKKLNANMVNEAKTAWLNCFVHNLNSGGNYNQNASYTLFYKSIEQQVVQSIDKSTQDLQNLQQVYLKYIINLENFCKQAYLKYRKGVQWKECENECVQNVRKLVVNNYMPYIIKGMSFNHSIAHGIFHTNQCQQTIYRRF